MKMKICYVLLIALCCGCSGSEFTFAPVSGTVTLDGEPLVGADLVFAPLQSGDSINVGPASIGKTDEAGKYQLTSIRGNEGAIVTKHRVSIAIKGISTAELARRVDLEYSKNSSMSERKFNALENKIRKSMEKELGAKKFVPEVYNTKTSLTFEVQGPTDDANFDLKSDGS